MTSRYGRSPEGKVYVGDLPKDITDQDLKSSFGYYGALRSVWIARNPPGFAFVEFEDSRDADDAVRGLDGTTIAGSRVKVEHSTGKVRPKPWLGGGRGGGGGGRGPRRPVNPDERCYECGDRGHYAYDCRNRRRSGGGGGGGAWSGGSRNRGRARSRSRSYDRDRSYSRSRSSSRNRSRSRSRD